MIVFTMQLQTYKSIEIGMLQKYKWPALLFATFLIFLSTTLDLEYKDAMRKFIPTFTRKHPCCYVYFHTNA